MHLAGGWRKGSTFKEEIHQNHRNNAHFRYGISLEYRRSFRGISIYSRCKRRINHREAIRGAPLGGH